MRLPAFSAHNHIYKSVLIGENPAGPAFVRLDLRNHVEWRLVDDASNPGPLYLASMQSQLDPRYHDLATLHGWRVIIFHDVEAKSADVLYVWNHPHHDGLSGKIFHEQLLQSLNREVKESVIIFSRVRIVGFLTSPILIHHRHPLRFCVHGP
ncbi:hypothetical protein F5X99DRAFT_388471 [Biscogniauxia marginata]|nr:hypothetical protein F5X99DRAFT_388471 [Biscogniauxia marginata]